MIILMYYECVLRVMGKNKKIYEYTNVLQPEYKAIEGWLKHNQVGRTWQYLKKTKECYHVQERTTRKSASSVCRS